MRLKFILLVFQPFRWRSSIMILFTLAVYLITCCLGMQSLPIFQPAALVPSSDTYVDRNGCDVFILKGCLHSEEPFYAEVTVLLISSICRTIGAISFEKTSSEFHCYKIIFKNPNFGHAARLQAKGENERYKIDWNRILGK